MIYQYKSIYIKSILVTLTLLLTYTLFLLPWVKYIELKGYDFLSSLNTTQSRKAPIVIVGIDEVSLNQFPLQWPWPRAVHAKLIDILYANGAKSVIFDIVFAQKSDKNNDIALKNAIKKHKDITLASDHYVLHTKQYDQELDVLPLKMFLDAGAKYANAQLPIDNDTVIRRVPLDTQKLWSKSLTLTQTDIDKVSKTQELYIHYYDLYNIDYASYYQAVEPSLLPKNYFNNKIVIIGLYSNISSINQKDSFVTPLFIQNSQLLPGVFIHANIIANYLNNDFISPLSKSYHYALAVVATLLLLLLLWHCSLYTVTLITLGFITIILFLADFLFTQGIWFHYIYIISNITTLYILYWLYIYIKTYQEKRFIKDAFKHYISPQMVDELAKNPELLHLKGERKKITVLFCDLANFTSISEQSSPLELSAIINEYFSLMTHALHQNHATVDKFIGDAVMAFWGSPLEDDKQADHAIEAALEMLKIFDKFSVEQKIFQKYNVRLRIGIYTGVAIIGNFGSTQRLSYTAIGDSVNTASRLEGANKITKTSILIGKSTYDELSKHLQEKFKPEGKVALKGKQKEVNTFSYR